MLTRYFSKVYWENAVQIISPHDEGIAASILENLEPAGNAWDRGSVISSTDCIDNTEELIRGYFEQLAKLNRTRWVLSPLDVRSA